MNRNTAIPEGQLMRSIINHLNQIQELILVRDEQRAIQGAAADFTAINQNIDTLVDSLDGETKGAFQRLFRKDHIVMAPMSNDSCAICGMHLAIAQVQAVKLCQKLVTCPSCARIIYDPSGARWVAQPTSRASAEAKVGVARFSSPDLMIPELTGTTPTEVIEEFALILQKAQFVDDAAKLAETAIARENMLGTGVGHELAFPHARGIEGGGLALAFGVSRNGVKFQGVTDTPAKLVFFCTIPTAVSAFYLRLLASLTDAFAKEANRKAALQANTPSELWKVLTKATRKTLK
ncbi:MAG: PTS sugar transporter subunit IIA [Kiritimatiellia bacterium]|jgi:mannitol/fructose-specific phosphotransferase system IIA component (Ntr-type)